MIKSYKTRWPFLYLVLLSSSFFIMCSNDINREKAKTILLNSSPFDSTITEKLQIAFYEERFNKGDRFIVYAGPEKNQNSNEIQSLFTEYFDCLQSNGLIKYVNHGITSFRSDIQGPEYSIHLTENGKKSGLEIITNVNIGYYADGRETEIRHNRLIIPFKSTISLMDITGLKLNKEEGTALVEFSWSKDLDSITCGYLYEKLDLSNYRTAFDGTAFLFTPQVEFGNTYSGNAILSLYDDGWRAVSINLQ